MVAAKGETETYVMNEPPSVAFRMSNILYRDDFKPTHGRKKISLFRSTKNIKQDAGRSTSSLASSGAPLQSEVCRAAQELSISRDGPSIELESERSDAAKEEVEDGRHLWGACNTTQNRGGCSCSRPSTASRPGSSRSARSEAASRVHRFTEASILYYW